MVFRLHVMLCSALCLVCLFPLIYATLVNSFWLHTLCIDISPSVYPWSFDEHLSSFIQFISDSIVMGILFFFSFFFLFFFFVFSRASPIAFGGSQARGLIGAVVSGLHRSYSIQHRRIQLCLQPTPQFTATLDILFFVSLCICAHVV